MFLATYFDEATGSFRFPPRDGYVLRPDGTPIRWQQHLPPGSRIDRYGSECWSASPDFRVGCVPANGANSRLIVVERRHGTPEVSLARWSRAANYLRRLS